MARPALQSNGPPSTSHSTPDANGLARRRSRLSHTDTSREIERDQNNSSTLTLSPLVVRRTGRFSKTEDASTSVSKASSTTPAAVRAGGQGEVGVGAAEDDDELDGLERLRGWRNDAMTQHLYETAAFWGGKAWQVSGQCLVSRDRMASVGLLCPLPAVQCRRPERRFLASPDPFSHKSICSSGATVGVSPTCICCVRFKGKGQTRAPALDRYVVGV
jgi:hypothetical protein